MEPGTGFQTLERAGKWIPNTLRVQRITYAHGICQAPSFALLSYGPGPPGHPSGKGVVFSICAVVQNPNNNYITLHKPRVQIDTPKLNARPGRFRLLKQCGMP